MAIRLLSFLICALAVTGCANLPQVWLYGGEYEDAETSAFRYSGANRDFRTSVVGNPFDGPQADVDRAVIAAMKGEDKGLDTNFTLTPRTHYKDYHIIMLLNPAPERGNGRVCGAPRSLGRSAPDGRLVLAALFCDGDRLLFGVGGSRTPVGSPADTAFQTLVKDVMHYFVPQHSMVDEPREDDNDDD